MYSAYKLFKKNILESSQLLSLFEYTSKNLSLMNFDDLLRAHLVYSVSAFDKLIHDLIEIGMLEIFLNRRSPTPKYLSESFTLETHNKIVSATIPPKEHFFKLAVKKKLSYLSFQEPQKVVEGLSLIWQEAHKWYRIANCMGVDVSTAKTTLKTISTRRNQIVHEADIDISTGSKYSISLSETKSVEEFIFNCGESIYKSVI